jgi:hypothetical protein
MNDRNDEGAWFAAKRFGYGAGWPIAWQGWTLLALHAALVFSVAKLFHDQAPKAAALVIVAALLPLPVYAAKTRGGWKWRQGNDDR